MSANEDPELASDFNVQLVSVDDGPSSTSLNFKRSKRVLR